MTKKHLIAFLLIGLSLCIRKSPAESPNTAKNATSTSTHHDMYYHSLNFSDEYVPASDPHTKTKIKKELAKHHYQNLQTNKLHTKAKQWFPIIEPILKQYGIPKDFKYMPLVESGLHSNTSPKGASGHWQFMPQTARDFGLQVNMSVDERHDIKKSTIAACKYLKFLHSQFKSWTLAAAAYNGGEGTVKRQIAKHNHKNYFKMSLNKETACYVYKLVAMKEIIEKPDLHGYDKHQLAAKKAKTAYIVKTRTRRRVKFDISSVHNRFLLASQSF
mgnify:CR=1 FL=1